jgi:hypothetical protein
MRAQAYEGYFKNGDFFSSGQTIRIPDDRRVFITVFEEPAQEEMTACEKQARAFKEFFEEIRRIDDEPITEFERVKFKEIDI